jgi:hypothetical protein
MNNALLLLALKVSLQESARLYDAAPSDAHAVRWARKMAKTREAIAKLEG